MAKTKLIHNGTHRCDNVAVEDKINPPPLLPVYTLSVSDPIAFTSALSSPHSH